MKTINSQTGVKIKLPEPFCENYDSTLDIRRYGQDNLYPQHLLQYVQTSENFMSCSTRFADFLKGQSLYSNDVLDIKDIHAVIRDYSIFNGFALFVQYNGLGDIIKATHVPFETIRLGEKGENGIYTYCYICEDWSMKSTVNKKQISKKNIKRSWMFSESVETRLRRMQDSDYIGGEILYYSNTKSYPVERVRAALNYVSSEVGISNILYRDIRTNFLQSSVLCIPRQSDEDYNEFTENLTSLQGDEHAFKILTVEFSSKEDKPEVLNLNAEHYIDEVLKVSDKIRRAIIHCYNQEAFLRLEDGSLGFGSQAISEIYRFYNKQIESDRNVIIETLRLVYPEFDIEPLIFEAEDKIIENS